jgi:MerR family transcriptional regulator, light-induced transcriptional regulator
MSTLNEQIAQILDDQRDSLAKAIVDQHYTEQPELAERYGEKGRIKCLADAHYHLTYLSQAIAAVHPSLFSNYVAWAKVLLTGIGIPSEDLAHNLQIVRQVLKTQLSEEEGHTLIDDYINEGLTQLPDLPSKISPFIDEAEPHAELAEQYLQILLRGERHLASPLILNAVESGISVKDIYLHVFQRSQYEIGRLWQMNEISVAQEHYCTAATQLIMSQLYAYIFSTQRLNHALVATCVGGDLHEIGIRMVADFFEMAGWDTYYLGANTPSSSILQELKTRNAEVLAISATMTFHVRAVKELITAIRANPAFQNVKILVGGYPFNIEPTLWKEIGSDGYAKNADEAIHLANNLLN